MSAIRCSVKASVVSSFRPKGEIAKTRWKHITFSRYQYRIFAFFPSYRKGEIAKMQNYRNENAIISRRKCNNAKAKTQFCVCFSSFRDFELRKIEDKSAERQQMDAKMQWKKISPIRPINIVFSRLRAIHVLSSRSRPSDREFENAKMRYI